MLRPDVSMLLNDPELGGGQAFEIHRRERNRVNDTDVVTKIPASGNIQPASPEDLNQLPEADRTKAILVFRSKTPMQLGSDDGETYTAKDELHYAGKVYNVLQVDNWGAWGMYFAYATEKR